ncbi:4Fe-4S binding protein [Paucibacter soli]|uniref:4Fe-4S binding protein n=1 Tax=Paucibacter soli TaxID=3133433 RepID=UPI0030AE0E88
MHIAPIILHRPAQGWRARLARLGDALARHRGRLQALQWGVVAVYALLLVLPACLPLPQTGQTLFNNLTLAAQFVFWGMWWPGVILATLLFGRVWCGLLCPEGMLSELASRHGRGAAIPRWLRWRGWPVLAFVATTVYGQLISVYEYPKAALLVLGGSTVAAVAVGLLWGRGKRVWCRYLCPVSGVFALLARLSPLHYRVDRQAWDAYPQRASAVDCAPLLSVKQLNSASQCHACGRCSGHRDAVTLSARSPEAEIVHSTPREAGRSEALLLVWGLLGVAVAAFQWSASPWFVAWRQALAGWAAERELWALLDNNAPWWLLTHYPEAGDSFIWLDGLLIPAYIAAVTLLLGGCLQAALWAAARLTRQAWPVLALALVPLGAACLLAGLSMLTQTQLRAEGLLFPLADSLRLLALGAAALWSLRLLGRQLTLAGQRGWRLAGALALVALGLAPVLAAWTLQLRHW